MVSGPWRVILILIIDELCEFINKTLKALLFDIVTKTVVFIPDARPVFSVNMWHGTQLLKALCNTLRYEDIAMKCYRMLCVMNVWWWMCHECVMNVLWMCYGSVMNVLWMCYGRVMDVLWMCYGCYGCVMDVLWTCHGCVMDVLWMLWMHWGLLLMC